MTYEEKTKTFLAKQTHFVLGVTLKDATPWVVPLKIQKYESGIFEWDSKSDTIHSRALEKYPNVSVCIFQPDSNGFKEIGFYAKGLAKKIFNAENGYSTYQFTIAQAWYNDETHIKRKLDAKKILEGVHNEPTEGKTR